MANKFEHSHNNLIKADNASTMQVTPNCGRLFISLNLTGKMHNIAAITTCVMCNPICRARIETALKNHDYNCVCLYCYATDATANYSAARAHQVANSNILMHESISDTEISDIVAFLHRHHKTELRFESHGDCANATQACNYIRIAHACNAAGINCAIWTKNPAFYDIAIKQYGKPEHTTMILSSCHVNQIDTVKYDWIDKTFTVYSDKREADLAIERGAWMCKCGKDSCSKECHHCYNGETRFNNDNNGYVENIAEILRS